jgi:hypothetical protein
MPGEAEKDMRWLPTLLGVVAAFLMGSALAVATNPRPLFLELVTMVTGANVFDRCIKAGACNAVRSGPHDAPARMPPLKPQEAPPDLDRA